MAQHQTVRSPIDNPMYKFNGTGPATGPPQHLSYYMNPDVLLPRPAPRRTKRNVPDAQKDAHYWEKRKRNNEAARRSRENKRRLDLDIRQRVILIEEENNILHKELMVIKNKYGLSPDKRYLSTDENGELVGEVIEDDEYVHHKSGYSAIAESMKETSEGSENNYPASTSGSGSLSPTTSTLDFNDDYMPMKKRRRAKMDSENEEHSSTSPTTTSAHSPTTFSQGTNSWTHSSNGPAFYPNSQHLMQSYPELRNSGSKSPGKDHPTYNGQSNEAPNTSSHSSLQNSVFMPYASQAPGVLPSLMSIAADLAFHKRLSAESSKEVIKDYPSQVTTLHMQQSGNRFHNQRHQEEQCGNRSQTTNSFVSRSEKYQDQARLENEELRQRLEQLSAEVAKMKNFVMKDDLKSDGEGQKDSDSGEN